MRRNRTWVLVGAGIGASLALSGGLLAQGEKAKCPVSQKEFVATDKNPTILVNGQKVTFCCPNCPKPFAATPEKFITSAGMCLVNKNGAAKVAPASRAVVNNNLYYFCCGNCPKALVGNPGRFVKEMKDPVTGKAFEVKADSPRSEVGGQIYIFASPESKTAFDKESAKFVVVFK